MAAGPAGRMNAKGLPGLEVLFREQTRLSKKLSAGELTAIRRYIEQRVAFENQSLLFKLRHLKSTQELSESEYQRSLTTLQRELEKEKWIAQEFQREFESLARVLQQRDERYRLKNDTLISDLKKARQTLSGMDDMKERMTKEMKQKNCVIEEQELKLNQLRDSNRKRYEIVEQKYFEERDKMKKEILKLKYMLDEKSKEITNLKIELYERKLVEKNVRFKDIYCEAGTCKARADLDQCRAQLVQKCTEITSLNFQIEQGKQKIREQAKLMDYLSPVLRQRDDARYNIGSSTRQKKLSAYSLPSERKSGSRI
ncbi:centrosomal protein of 112 kDa-like [Haliotis asinina]|uniref:centrosomal protein of 112 kDa-like n=1 Tax=Haliotis asinina TaxID=109174 RepID=UPI003531A279